MRLAIDEERLVYDIKENERAWKEGRWERTWLSWSALCDIRDISKIEIHGMGVCHDCNHHTSDRLEYRAYMHSLYTLRAYSRGKMHRHTPPEPLRGFNFSMRTTGNGHRVREWDMESHNKYIAEKQAQNCAVSER